MKTALTALIAATLVGAGAAHAQKIVFNDPLGDDHGPGGYAYPTDAVFKPGSFDMEQVTISPSGSKVEFSVKMASTLEDPWRLGVGYSVQMVFIFIDTDNVAGSGHTDGLPGLNVKFNPANAWDKVVVLSPQSPQRVASEVRTKAPGMAADIVTTRSRGVGPTIRATVDLAELGGGDPADWSYQVVVQSNEGFPLGRDLLTRPVNEYEGQQRFGGGNDDNCDPHVLDVLAGGARGEASEIAAQHAMLAYECDLDGSSLKMATLGMVRR